MKIFTAGLLCETNTFSSIPTTIDSFKECYFKQQGNHGEHYWAAPLKYFAAEAHIRNWECIEGLCAGAMPGAPIVQTDYEFLRDEILKSVSVHAKTLDAIFLHLHGAMIAEGYEDCEGDLLFKLRQIVGPKVLISVLLDPHTHLTQAMSDNANLLLWLKEYPHTDIKERAEDLFRITLNIIEKKIIPTNAIFDCKMIDLFPTTISPMKNIIEKIRAIETTDPEVLNISISHGFPWGDVEDGFGTKVIVTTDNNHEKAEKIANEIGNELFKFRGKFLPKFYNLDEAWSHLENENNKGLIVLADFADNVGGGAPGDSTFVLQKAIEKKTHNGALACIWDPEAVITAKEAGLGKKIILSLGGKHGVYSGSPAIVHVVVKYINPNLQVKFAGSDMNFGASVALHIEEFDFDIVINSIRCQTYSTECFTEMGIDLAKKRFVVVKSMEHYRKSFSILSKHLLPLKSPGALCPNLANILYKGRGKDIWPQFAIDENDLNFSSTISLKI